jgi:lipopolysaccharide biosynthesis protein
MHARGPRLLAFYLPQFHPTPYNNEWWGPGFTEWTNVVKARPRFRGHYQPHLPADLGFYDLRLAETRQAQADLAREYGIHGFCYYHYWFSGRRLLERPFDEVLALGTPDLPFCICWANENWSRSWDGSSHHLLVSQQYSLEDDLEHIRFLVPALRDPRYVRIEQKAMVLVYRVEGLPYPEKTAEIWRTEAIRQGVGDLYLVSVESNFGPSPRNPGAFGFDCALQFEPNRCHYATNSLSLRVGRRMKNLLTGDSIWSYPTLYRSWLEQPTPSYRRFDCVTPMWDNSARRGKRAATIFTGSTPELYENWLRDAVARAQPYADGLKWVFINAWNEWAEGCHLEPCQRWGRSYLKSTKRVLEEALRAP